MTSPAPNQRRSGRQNGQDYNHVCRRDLLAFSLSQLVNSIATLQLLGFTLPPRAAPASTHLPRRSAKRSHNYGGFDRQRFVHQFRYVVKPDKG